MNTPVNPFALNYYPGPAFFCDRQDETKTLLANIRHGKHTCCFALRRLGKTALIRHVFHQLQKQRSTACIYLDIYATQNLKDLTNQLANSVYTLFPEKKGIGKSFWEFIKLFRPVLSVNELSGNPELSLDIAQSKQLEKTLPQILDFLDSQKIRTVIAFDEFQQVLTYPEKNVEALLRTSMQRMKNVTFLFSGSNQHLMHELFHNAKRPFYASCSNLTLQRIDRGVYFTFIKKIFLSLRIKISTDSIDYILEFSDTYTYYTQRICHDLVQSGMKVIDVDTVKDVIRAILDELKVNFYQYRNLLTASQWHLLEALAKEEKVSQPYTRNFIQKYQLGSPAIVKRSLEALLSKEMVYKELSATGSHIAVYDKFLQRWLQMG